MVALLELESLELESLELESLELEPLELELLEPESLELESGAGSAEGVGSVAWAAASASSAAISAELGPSATITSPRIASPELMNGTPVSTPTAEAPPAAIDTVLPTNTMYSTSVVPRSSRERRNRENRPMRIGVVQHGIRLHRKGTFRLHSRPQWPSAVGRPNQRGAVQIL